MLVGHHEAFALHETGSFHPERPARLQAVLAGVTSSESVDGVVSFAPRRADPAEVERVHGSGYLASLAEFCRQGGGHLDADTAVVPASFEAALRAAGAGLEAAARLRAGEGDAAFLAVRPPGHHALSSRAMGFCLINNVAVCAAALVAEGERVAIVDWDAHHGNGTQAIFWESSEVLYVSLHQYPFYPGSGGVDEIGEGEGLGATVNVPLPAGSAGDTYRRAIDEVVLPALEAHRPDWVLVSAGFDAHRADPLTDLGLSAGDFADLTARTVAPAPSGRRIVFLEGGYDLEALQLSVRSCIDALAGEITRPEPATGPSPVDERAGAAVLAARQAHFG